MQGTSSLLWRFNPLLLQLLREIAHSLLCSHSSWGSSLDLDMPLHLGHQWVSVYHSDRTGLKEQLLQVLWLTKATGSNGYGMWGQPAAAEASMILQQPEVHCMFSWGSCPWIKGPWQWWAAQDPGRRGVNSDPCFHTGFLVAAVAALASHVLLWCLC